MILCLETATSVCSVALCTAGGVISERHNSGNRSHAALLTVFIDELLKEQGMTASDLEAVAVSRGPGSYTGLRIGVSVAKGIAYRAGIPIIAVDTPLSMYHGMKNAEPGLKVSPSKTIWCPMLDARRLEVYYCLFDDNGKARGGISAMVVGEDSFSDIPEEYRIIFFGDGAMKCENVIKRKNTVFHSAYEISAADMRIPAYSAFNAGKFEDIAYFEPFYLKDFITTIQKKNVIG